jgi:hypothetical protein
MKNIDLNTLPAFHDLPVRSVVPLERAANDDLADRFNTQEGSHWDGLGHVGRFRHELFHNGVSVEETR